jgi:hypothetical protein
MLNMLLLMKKGRPLITRILDSPATIVCWIAAVLPALFTVFLVSSYSVDIPYRDDWALALRIEKIYTHTFSFNDLFVQQNAHRIFFPLLLMLPTAVLSKWNIFYWLVLSLVFAAGTFLLFAYQITATGKQIGNTAANLLIPAVSIIVFSQKQFINWLFGIQLIVFMSIFFVVAGIVLLAKKPFDVKYFISAAITGFIATFSFANGLVFWPLGVIIILLAPCPSFKQKSKYAFCWLIITAATVYLFFYQYNTSQEVSPSLSLHTIAAIIFFVFSYLGNPLTPVNFHSFSNPLFPGSHYLPFLLGIIGFIIFTVMSFVLIRQKRIPLWLMTPYFCFCLYSLASALMIAIGRVASFGYKESLAARYVTHGNLFWIGILSLIYFAWQSVCDTKKPYAENTGRKNFRQYVFMFLFLILSSLSFVASYRSQEDFFKLRDDQERVRSDFIATPEDGFVPPAWNMDKIHSEAFSIIRKRRLSIYRDKPQEELPPPKK